MLSQHAHMRLDEFLHHAAGWRCVHYARRLVCFTSNDCKLSHDTGLRSEHRHQPRLAPSSTSAQHEAPSVALLNLLSRRKLAVVAMGSEHGEAVSKKLDYDAMDESVANPAKMERQTRMRYAWIM